MNHGLKCWKHLGQSAAILTLFVILVLGCSKAEEPVSVPVALHGTWKTESSGYADRFFTVSANTIVLGKGGGTADQYPIRKLETKEEREGTLYALAYVNELEKYEDTIFFYYSGDGGGTIKFKNQPNLVWKK